jgi:hypothetical protein
MCWECRARVSATEATISNFVTVRKQTLDPQLSSGAGPRALLKARLSQLTSDEVPAKWWSRLFQTVFTARRIVYVGAVLFLAALGAAIMGHFALSRRSEALLATVPTAPIPDRNLTPGATRSLRKDDVCRIPKDDPTVQIVSFSVRRTVLQEYGMVNASAKDYELDFLITPELGGSNEVRNLWPEPYSSTVWNAHVKDALEDRLHQMVCSGQLDLSTAQQDIASDWVAAYKKYFHTDHPVSDRPPLD